MVSPHPHLLLPGSYLACPSLILMAKEQSRPPQCKREACRVYKWIRGEAEAPHVPCPVLHWGLFMAQMLPPKGTTCSWWLPMPLPHGLPDGPKSPVLWSIRSPLQTDHLQMSCRLLPMASGSPSLPFGSHSSGVVGMHFHCPALHSGVFKG